MRRIIRILRLMRMKRIRMRRFLTMLRIKNRHVKYTRILCSPSLQFLQTALKPIWELTLAAKIAEL